MATDYGSTVSMWVCLMLSVVLIVVRVSLRRWRGHYFARGDYWCMLAAVFILARLIANHILVLYGSTRTLSPQKRIQLLDPAFASEASKIVIGSKIILLTRTLLVCILWCLKAAVLDLLARLITKMSYEQILLYTFRAVLISTFTASVVTVFVQCRPFQRHWQVNPDPGDCTIGDVWLLTYEISNIVTDIMLMSVPIPLILSAKMPTMQRLRLLLLFSIGIFLISLSIIRIMLGKDSRAQSAHTLWASLEILFAVFVAVIPTMYALVRNRHEHTSYSTHPVTTTVKSRVCPGSVEEDDKYTARVWTELEDRASRTDNTSVEGILVETSYETSETRLSKA